MTIDPANMLPHKIKVATLLAKKIAESGARYLRVIYLDFCPTK